MEKGRVKKGTKKVVRCIERNYDVLFFISLSDTTLVIDGFTKIVIDDLIENYFDNSEEITREKNCRTKFIALNI